MEDYRRRVVRAAKIFSSSVSQADYMAAVVLLEASIETLASAISVLCNDCLHYCKEGASSRGCGERALSRIRRILIEEEKLAINNKHAKYPIDELRNAIVHGKTGKGGITFEKAEEIVMSGNAIKQFEHKVAARTRDLLSEAIGKPGNIADRICKKLTEGQS